MSIYQLDISGKDKVQTAIDRLKRFEPEDGYYLAFSGGKDSVTIKALADMAGVKYDAHYSITSVDPPELVNFIKHEYPDVIRDRQHWKTSGTYHKAGDPVTMWNLISEQTMPPTRPARYCCRYLKEERGRDRFVITGVRWAESARRKSTRASLELAEKVSQPRELHDADSEQIGHIAQKYARRVLNPIIDWTDAEIWEFIKAYNVPYCELYDKGYKRLGCIGCPMSNLAQQEMTEYPKYKRAYLRAFERMIEKAKAEGKRVTWKTPEEVMRWWLRE